MSLLLLLLTPRVWAADLSGVLFREGGAPIAGATVTLGVSPTPVVGTTDGDGAFWLTAPAGTWPVRVQVPGDAPLTLAPVLLVDGEVTELLLTVTPAGLSVIAELPTVRELVIDEAVATGTLEGRVVDGRGKPVADARVFVRGQPVEARTDGDGRFALTLPAATHEISVLRTGYSTRSVADLVVPPDGSTAVTVELVEAGVRMDEFVVLMPRVSGGTATLLAERQDSSELVDTVSAEEMSRRGDSSAAAALQRVTGLTVVGGKYVYVRGLGERYSSTLMNGASLPSPEPERRVVPLDLFPTAMLDSVVIQKTFSPVMPAEFGGGVVRLRTRGVPDTPLLTVSVTGSYLDGTTFQQGLTGFDAGPADFWGIGAGYRALPQEIEDAADAEPLALKSSLPGSRGYDAETLEALGEAMPNRWGLTPTTALPDLSASVVTGRGWDIGKESRIGVLGGVTFSNGWQLTDYHTDFLTLEGEGLRVLNEYDFRDTENQIRLGGILEVAADISEDHHVRATTLLTRDTESAAREYIGYNEDIGTDIRVQRLRWVERQLLVQQLSGEHTLPDAMKNIGVTWRYSLALADRAEPDRRDILLQPDETTGEWRMRTQGGGNAIFFSELDDINHDAGLDLALPFGDTESSDPAFGGELLVGGSIVRRERSVDTRRFGYVPKSGSGETDYLRNEPEDIFNEDTINPGQLQFEEQTLATDNYVAVQELEGVYVAADTDLPGRLSLLTGVRREHSRQEVRTFQLFTTEPVEEVADLETTDWLPAATLTHRIGTRRPGEESRMQVRAGYGRTLSRPDFRELSPAVFNDVVGGREVSGNAELQRATIDNYDLRWEFYPASSESLSIGGFYKHFTNPIESIVVVGAVSRISYANAESADNVGIELEFRKSLGLGSEPPRWLSDTYLSGNAALIQSQVDLGDAGGNQTSDVRPLQGQSPYVLNLQLTYEGLDSPLSLAVLYNVFGPRIAEVGDAGLPDTYEEPTQRVDASASVRLGEAWRVKLSGRNLLNAPSRLTIADQTVREIRTGWSVGLGLTWSPLLGQDN